MAHSTTTHAHANISIYVHIGCFDTHLCADTATYHHSDAKINSHSASYTCATAHPSSYQHPNNADLHTCANTAYFTHIEETWKSTVRPGDYS